MSFVNPHGPDGERFLGVAIVDVTPEDVNEILAEKPEFRTRTTEQLYTIGAIRKAWKTGCNPGGEVLSSDVTDAPADKLARFPRHQLMTREEVDLLEGLNGSKTE